MNELLPNSNQETTLNFQRKAGEAHPAPERGTPNWRRLKVATQRYSDLINDGFAKATEAHTVIDQDTARCVAHTLGRAFGSTSALCEYGRTAQADYEAMRDEYLTLYNHPDTPAWLTEQVNWLGTHLIRDKYPLSQTISYPEQYPLILDQLLVPTQAQVKDCEITVHVPGSYGRDAISGLEGVLGQLNVNTNPGLQAYLSLPNVNVMTKDIEDGFHSSFIAEFADLKEAIHDVIDLDQREREINDFASDRHLFFDYLIPDYEALGEELLEHVDLVERHGRIYVFDK